jgi:hypothetical protein
LDALERRTRLVEEPEQDLVEFEQVSDWGLQIRSVNQLARLQFLISELKDPPQESEAQLSIDKER